MAESSTLAQKIKTEFEAREQRRKEAEQTHARESQDREKRLAQFDSTCEELKAVWGPSFQDFAKHFGDKVQVTPTITPGSREAKMAFLTPLANMTLTVSAVPSPDATKLVLDYDLLIIPIYFDYERHSRLEMPLDKVDKNAVRQWVEDRLMSCVKAYLAIQDNEHYRKRAMVEDPITKARFLPDDAAARLEHGGKIEYFSSQESLLEYKKKHQID